MKKASKTTWHMKSHENRKVKNLAIYDNHSFLMDKKAEYNTKVLESDKPSCKYETHGV